MKTVKKNVYYCDFCNKKSLNGAYIKRHEEGCTNNPGRHCKLCEGREIREFIEQLKQRFEIRETEPDEYSGISRSIEWRSEPITLNEILEFTEGCPNCTLSILRQTKLNYKVFGFEYDYKKEMATWWSEKNKEEWEKERREMACGYYY